MQSIGNVANMVVWILALGLFLGLILGLNSSHESQSSLRTVLALWNDLIRSGDGQTDRDDIKDCFIVVTWQCLDNGFSATTLLSDVSAWCLVNPKSILSSWINVLYFNRLKFHQKLFKGRVLVYRGLILDSQNTVVILVYPRLEVG